MSVLYQPVHDSVLHRELTGPITMHFIRNINLQMCWWVKVGG